MAKQPRDYQHYAHKWLLPRLMGGGGAGLFMDMGLGKTLVSLMTIDTLRLLGEVERVLVVSPLRVMSQVWPEEIADWGYDLTTTVLHGRDKKRLVREDTDMHIINTDGVKWLAESRTRPKYDLVIIDESTTYKNWTAKRSRAMRKLIRDTPRRIILTGSPAINAYADLHGQIYLLDEGERLGKTLTVFRERFMHRGGWAGRGWELDINAEDAINRAIGDIVLRMAAEDFLDMPQLVINDVWVDLPPDAREIYETLEKDFFVELDDDKLLVGTAGGLYAKLKTLTNGGLYVEDDYGTRTTHDIHTAKLDAVDEITEGLNGKPMLLAYQFKQDAERLRARYPKAEFINGDVAHTVSDEILANWNYGGVCHLFVQPLSLSHGANCQKGGSDLVWFGLSDRPELYAQLNARLYRQGAKGPQVRIHRILARNTVDEAIAERLDKKTDRQEALFEALDRYRRNKHATKTR